MSDLTAPAKKFAAGVTDSNGVFLFWPDRQDYLVLTEQEANLLDKVLEARRPKAAEPGPLVPWSLPQPLTQN